VARQFLILIRMAKKSHKVLFAGTIGMQMMEFLCAINF
jgi:hypothetical protein